ncbi:MAG: flippase-like domain-containing protein [Desulfobacteraceae bacterium]|nr:flippase-like domain-containing protein [Desulfobacteraceae bacterium]
MRKKASTKWIWGTIAIIAVVFIIFALVVDIDALLAIFQQLHLGLFSIGVVFLLMGIMLITIRWRFLLRNEPGFAPTFHANSVSYMLKLLLPIPQAVTRLVTLSLVSSIGIYQSAPMMMIERFLETIMRLVFLTLAIVLIFDIPLWIAGLVIAAILLLAIPTFVTWFTRNASTVVPRLLARSARIPDLSKEKLREGMVDFQNNVSTMRAARGITVAVGYSLAMWGLFLLFFVFGFQALGSDLNTRQIVAMSATVLAILPPSTPAMIGVYQGIIVAVLLPFGYFDVNTATAYALLMFGAQLVVWIVLGIWGLRRTDIKISKLSQVSFD